MADSGRIVSISAALTTVGYDNTLMYASTKGALEQFTLAASKELGKRGIVCKSPFKRLAEPQDIADVVAFLASDGARWVSGQNIRANGAALWMVKRASSRLIPIRIKNDNCVA
ncbi:SDR family oxidoreductase [Polaromonas sp. P1-6]|nr:SDR family oxidoreductase [Polaromonas sp. P1-6]